MLWFALDFQPAARMGKTMSNVEGAGSTGKSVSKPGKKEAQPLEGLRGLAVARWFRENPQLAYSATILLMGTVGFIRQTIYFDTFGITYIAYAGLTDMVVDSVEILLLLLFWTAIFYIFGIALLGYMALVMTAGARMGYRYTASSAGILKPFLHPGREFGANLKNEWSLAGERFRTTNAWRKKAMAVMWRSWTGRRFWFLKNGRAFFAFMIVLLVSIGALSGVSARGMKYCEVKTAHLHNQQDELAGSALFCHVGDQPGKGRMANLISSLTMSTWGDVGDLIGIPNLFRSMFERPLVKLTLVGGRELPEPYIMLGSTSSHSFFYGPIEEGVDRLALVIRRDSLSIIRAYSGAPAHQQKSGTVTH